MAAAAIPLLGAAAVAIALVACLATGRATWPRVAVWPATSPG